METGYAEAMDGLPLYDDWLLLWYLTPFVSQSYANAPGCSGLHSVHVMELK